MSTYPLGTRSVVPPIPIDMANARSIDAGVVTLVLEHRRLSAEIIEANFGPKSEAREIIGGLHDVSALDDEGPSIHVLDSQTGREWLRFDMFSGDLHYHYLCEEAGPHVMVTYDERANGPMWDWTERCLKTRLPEMLIEAGAVELAGRVDRSVLAGALDQLNSIAGTLS